IIPLRIAYIRQEAPLSMQGEVLGYNTSLRFLGNIIGPALGGMLASLFGFASVFVVTDRKSTRLNSSHVSISYAVFCLNKKTLVQLLIRCSLKRNRKIIFIAMNYA